MSITRRGLAASALLTAAAPASANAADPWAHVRAAYDLPEGVIQLENGNWGAMAKPVRAAYEEHTRRVNRDTSYYARRSYNGDLEVARGRAAEALGVDPAELVFTRGASEALQALIGGYNKLKPGDGVLIADVDYDAMQTAMRWLKERRGARVMEFALPEAATRAEIVEAYRAAFDANPHVRLALLTYVSHRHGLRLPVADIAALARARGIATILDAAHAWGQIECRLRDLGCDFVGLNAHKWIGAPIGVGVLYAAKSRIVDIDPFMGEQGYAADDIRSRVHTGTSDFAAYLSLTAALDFRASLGGLASIEARLTALRSRWTERLRGQAGVTVLASRDPSLCSAIASFRLTGKTAPKDNAELARTLLDRFGIFTVARAGLAGGGCVRVTPGVFTTEAEVDALAAAVETLTA